MMRFIKAFVLLGLAASSLPITAPAAARTAPALAHKHRVSGLAVIPLKITSHGRVHRFQVEFARTSDEQSRGLMFRTAMGADEGMIFPMQPPRTATFWMHNTVLPLDLVFIGTDNRIITIAANAVPYSDAQIPSGGIVKGVLELNGGRAAALRIRVGDRVSW
jgi:uncharacterized membrane protein (UPF0127 family)